MNDIKDHERNYDKIEERGLPALLNLIVHFSKYSRIISTIVSYFCHLFQIKLFVFT